MCQHQVVFCLNFVLSLRVFLSLIMYKELEFVGTGYSICGILPISPSHS